MPVWAGPPPEVRWARGGCQGGVRIPPNLRRSARSPRDVHPSSDRVSEEVEEIPRG